MLFEVIYFSQLSYFYDAIRIFIIFFPCNAVFFRGDKDFIVLLAFFPVFLTFFAPLRFLFSIFSVSLR